MTDPENTSISAEAADGIYFAVPRRILASEEIDWSFPSDQQVMQQAERDQHPYVPSNLSDKPRLMDHFEPDVDEYLLRCSLDKFESQTVSSFRNNIITQLGAALQDNMTNNSGRNGGLSSSGDEMNCPSSEEEGEEPINMKQTDVKLSSIYKNNISYSRQSQLFQNNKETNLSQTCITTGPKGEEALEWDNPKFDPACLNKNLLLTSMKDLPENVRKTDLHNGQSNDTPITRASGSQNEVFCQNSDLIPTTPQLKNVNSKENYSLSRESGETLKFLNDKDDIVLTDQVREDRKESNLQTHMKHDHEIKRKGMELQYQADDPFFTATLRRNLRLEDETILTEIPKERSNSTKISTSQMYPIDEKHPNDNFVLTDDFSFTQSLRRNLLLEDDEFSTGEIVQKNRETISIDTVEGIERNGPIIDEGDAHENLNEQLVRLEYSESKNTKATIIPKKMLCETNDANLKSFPEKELNITHRETLSRQSLFLHSMIVDPIDSPLQLNSTNVTEESEYSHESNITICKEVSIHDFDEEARAGKKETKGEGLEIGITVDKSQMGSWNDVQPDLERKCQGIRSESVTITDHHIKGDEEEDQEIITICKLMNFKKTFEDCHVPEVLEGGKHAVLESLIATENEVHFQEFDDSSSRSFVPKCLPRTSKSLKTLGPSSAGNLSDSSDIDDSTLKILEVQKYFREKPAKFSVSDVILETSEDDADPTPEPPDTAPNTDKNGTNLLSSHFAQTPKPVPRNKPEEVIISVSDEDRKETVETRVLIKNLSLEGTSTPAVGESSDFRSAKTFLSPRNGASDPSVSPDPADWAKHLSRDARLCDLSPSPESSSSSSNLWLSCTEADRQVNLLNYDIFRTDFSDADPDLNSAWPFSNDQPRECLNVFHSECYALHL